VLIFEVALNATTMFNHSNIRIPVSIDRILLLFVVPHLSLVFSSSCR